MAKKKKSTRKRATSAVSKRRTPRRPGVWIVMVIVFIGAVWVLFLSKPKSPDRTPPTRTTSAPPPADPDFSESQPFQKEGELAFVSVDGDTLATIDIEIADTEPTRRRGLMFRQQMDEYEGMLFIFDQLRYQGFWMKNTPLPLDIIFVNDNFEIVTIVENTIPFVESTYPSTAPAIYVVEVNAGFSAQHSVRVGGTISFRRL